MEIMQEVTEREGLLHAEIQSEDDKQIIQRLLEYNLMATLTYQKPVLSFLILLRPMPEIPQSPFISALFNVIESWRFSYMVIKLWEISAEELLHSGLIGPLPLLPLTKGGTEQEALAATIATLYRADEYELLSLTKLLAGLVMKRKDQQELLERMFAMYKDIVEESWVYQKIMQQGLGLGEQRALLAIIQKRFPNIAETAKELIDAIPSPDKLETLIGEVSVAQNSQEVLRLLRGL